jgi:hypothetical protein
MRSGSRSMGVSCCLCFALVGIQAQTPVSPSQSKDKTEQMMEDARRGLFQPPRNPAIQAGQITKSADTSCIAANARMPQANIKRGASLGHPSFQH